MKVNLPAIPKTASGRPIFSTDAVETASAVRLLIS
ncbi:uncharacterized protein METZ01_LOCUS402786 [marine metagenome]|uniref:Uncharacterized protein n=1 Tax=marine metagenome TaxID=408172 RepID=A0A382VTV1_9ZZZZ